MAGCEDRENASMRIETKPRQGHSVLLTLILFYDFKIFVKEPLYIDIATVDHVCPQVRCPPFHSGMSYSHGCMSPYQRGEGEGSGRLQARPGVVHVGTAATDPTCPLFLITCGSLPVQGIHLSHAPSLPTSKSGPRHRNAKATCPCLSTYRLKR